jgi:hypothetical protein
MAHNNIQYSEKYYDDVYEYRCVQALFGDGGGLRHSQGPLLGCDGTDRLCGSHKGTQVGAHKGTQGGSSSAVSTSIMHVLSQATAGLKLC